MSDTDLPQPIYPPGSGAATPSTGAAPPPAGLGGGYGGPPGPGGATGYGSGSAGGGGMNPKVLIAIGAAVVVIIAGVVFAMTRGGDDGSGKAGETSTTLERSSASTARDGAIGDPKSTTRPPATDPVDTAADLRGRAESVAALQLDSAGPETVACMADGFEASPTMLDTIEPMDDAVSFTDPSMADEFARIVVSCATYDELLAEFESLLITEGVLEPQLSCVVGNMSSFGAPQWQDFLATVLQPAEASYAEQLFADLAVC
ncbi:MAG TPA: hypothetical protein VFN21_05685 [Acidimicrobiales bacterium]|nr:hypothetical protein [Acidimicrobiales bacterium]